MGLQCCLQEIPHCPKSPRISYVLFVSSAICANSVSQGWPHKARSVMSRSPGTEALGAGTKKSLSLPFAGILAINPENRSLPLSWALSALLQTCPGLCCMAWGCRGRLPPPRLPAGSRRAARVPGTAPWWVRGCRVPGDPGRAGKSRCWHRTGKCDTEEELTSFQKKWLPKHPNVSFFCTELFVSNDVQRTAKCGAASDRT